MRIDAARKDVQAGRVDLVGRGPAEVRTDRDDATVRDFDVGFVDAACRDDRASADDHDSDSSSRNVKRTSIATATSSMVTDSAGLWLTPPLQRTKSIAPSRRADIATPTGPPPPPS